MGRTDDGKRLVPFRVSELTNLSKMTARVMALERRVELLREQRYVWLGVGFLIGYLLAFGLGMK